MAIAADPATVEAAAKNARGNRARQTGGAVSGRASRSAWLLTGVLAVCGLTVLLPLYLTVTMAFKTPEQSVDGNGFSLPAPLNPSSFADAWNLVGFPTAFVISVLVAAASVAGVIVLASLAAYAIVRQWDNKLFKYSYFYLLAAMFIPFPVIALPQVKLTAYLSLDNPVGVAVLHILFQLSFSVLLYSAFLRSIPGELEESARIDGATTWQVFWKLIFPLLAPMNATVGIFAFLAAWNDFMMPSLITANPDLQTIPVIQQIFQSSFSTDYNVAFASYLMAMAPTIIVYVFAQRWVMSGVTRGAIK
ncbi:carbohydrate ABC transporter permease [Quadrisphaera setariae]|uniref:Carbohydrate ABC transporter permease n=1 Tax=Quadrisphaera setariae TaxID=2593304 RepID=A0A5C8Z4M4_9ACTN|nr:carbohydrate ABC transporter permease [Quadrisphaera setariae]TXR52219.1 carbohydrate ABC transporter permease [Quadrisphaera setariae]